MPKGIYNHTGNKGMFQKGHEVSREIRSKISIATKAAMTEEVRKKITVAQLGKKRSSHTMETRAKIAFTKIGEKNPAWKGGISSISRRIRNSVEYKLWRKAVFIRDNYTCVFCGQVGGYLEADHIKPFALFPELRFAIDNGRTLCIFCHRQTDTWGKRNI